MSSSTPFSLSSLVEKVRTPHRLGRLVLAPSYQPGDFDSHGVDVPFVYRHAGQYWMTYVGFDGRGYQTGLAVSDDLLTWAKQGVVLGRGPAGSVTEHNAALTCILRDNDLFGTGELIKVNGRYLGTYHAYPKPGYEEGPAVIGLCTSDDLRHWEIEPPILRAEDGAAWERGGLYKSWLMRHDDRYYLFYNAKNEVPHGQWREQTGLAVSDDLRHWERYSGNPLLPNGPAGSFDELFASDPCVFRCDDAWVMFYFGLAADNHAREGVAFSHDLLHWHKHDAPLIDVGDADAIDARYAHKPSLIASADCRLHHFYCAVRQPGPANTPLGNLSEPRGITVAFSD